MDWTSYLTFSADVSRTVTEGHKILFALIALLLALLWPTQRSPRVGHGLAIAVMGLVFALEQLGYPLIGMQAWVVLAFGVVAWPAFRDVHARLAPGLLLLLALVTTANYARWGPRSTVQHVDTYDLMHYYLNAKYFDELGYLDLYPACILADVENGGPHFDKDGNKYMAQDDGGHQLRPLAHGVQRGRKVRDERFTPERWASFERDFLHMQRELPGMSDRMWREMIRDHGFNGTPVWTMIAAPFARVVPADGALKLGTYAVPSLKLLGLLDVALLAGALVAVAWAYGGVPALWVLVFFGVSYSTRWPTVSWVFLRYDWVAAMLFAMVALKKRRPYIAGLFAGWSAALRLFPAFWMWGPLCKGLAGLTRRVVHKPLLVFALGFCVVVAVLEVGAVARFGFDTVKVHMENMSDHNRAEQLSSRRVGLALALAYRGPWEPEPMPRFIEPERKQRIGEQKPLRYAIALAVMLALGWGLRRSDDDEAYGYGFLPIFLLTTMSYYYYVARVTLILVHAADPTKLRNQLGLAALFGIEMFTNWTEVTYDRVRIFLIGYLAWAITAYVLVMVGMLLYDARAQDQKEAAHGG